MVTQSNVLPKAEPDQQQALTRFVTGAGLRYGLAFGLIFGLTVWLYDALALSLASSDLFWAKLAIGLPASLCLGALAGGLAARVPFASVSYLVWIAAGILFAALSAHVPFEGVSWLVRLMDARVKGLEIFPFGISAEYRMVVLMGAGAFAGFFTGIVQGFAVGWAWDRSTADNRMTVTAWGALLACAPLALALGISAEILFNAPLRLPQQQTYRVINFILHGPRDPQALLSQGQRDGFPYYPISLLRDSFTERFTQYLVEYDTQTLASTYVDLAFENGFILQCTTDDYGARVGYCGDLTEKYRDWMGRLLRSGKFQCDNCGVQVERAAQLWLEEHRTRFSERFVMTATHGPGSVLFLNVQYDSGYSMQCCLHGRWPVVLDECMESR